MGSRRIINYHTNSANFEVGLPWSLDNLASNQTNQRLDFCSKCARRQVGVFDKCTERHKWSSTMLGVFVLKFESSKGCSTEQVDQNLFFAGWSSRCPVVSPCIYPYINQKATRHIWRILSFLYACTTYRTLHTLLGALTIGAKSSASHEVYS